jgi:hypothetical protein
MLKQRGVAKQKVWIYHLRYDFVINHIAPLPLQILQKCSGKGPSSVHFMNIFSQKLGAATDSWLNALYQQILGISTMTWSRKFIRRIFDRNKKVTKKMVIRLIELLFTVLYPAQEFFT